MYLRILTLSLVVAVAGCKTEEVGFAPAVSNPFNPAPVSVDNGDDVTPIQPPLVEITQAPSNHMLGGQTSVSYRVVAGDFAIQQHQCRVDGTLVDCERSGTLALSGFALGPHVFSVDVVDVEGLSASQSADWFVSNNVSAKTDALTVNPSDNEADILFVIDNSGSMSEEQEEVALRISNFFEKVESLKWRVGIITTDPYELEPVSNELDPYADGVLVPFPNGQYYIDHTMPVESAKELFGQTIFRSESGNGHERGIRNTYRAIERSLSPGDSDANLQLANFFRPDASFAVVLISDEDETLLDGAGAPLFEQDRSVGQNLVNYVAQTWGVDKQFQFNSVIVEPGDFACISEFEKYGVAYKDLSELTGGAVEDICAEDYSSALSNIGSGVANLQKVYPLQCKPFDQDNDGNPDLRVIAGAGQPVPAFVVKEDKVEFAEALQPGDYSFEYECLIPVPN